MAVTWRGHTIWTHSRDRRADFPDSLVKFWGECSCGWKSTSRPSEDSATGAALNHLWRETVAPEFPVKGRMQRRHGETMSRKEFMAALTSSSRASA